MHIAIPSLSVCVVQFWELDPSMYGLRRSTRIQKDFTNSVMPSVDYVSGRGLLW